MHAGLRARQLVNLVNGSTLAGLGVAVLGERLPVLSWCGLGVLAAGLGCLAVPMRDRTASPDDRGRAAR